MKYLLMMQVPRATGEYEIFGWSPETSRRTWST